MVRHTLAFISHVSTASSVVVCGSGGFDDGKFLEEIRHVPPFCLDVSFETLYFWLVLAEVDWPAYDEVAY